MKKTTKTKGKTPAKKKPARKAATKSAPAYYVNPHRITRSIAFKKDLHAYAKKRAKEMGRSLNWFVNNLIAGDNVPASAPQAQPVVTQG